MPDLKANSYIEPRTVATPPENDGLAAPEPLAVPASLCHDWLLGMRGGEWVLNALLKLLPQAGVRTLFCRPERLDPLIRKRKISVSALNRLPGAARYYRWLLPLMPLAASRLTAPENCRICLKTSHCAAHGMPAPDGSAGIHYYFSPMRYLYDQADAYAAGGGGLGSKLLGAAAPALRRWDWQAAQRADFVWAISRFVADRVERIYGRPADVIYPPVRTEVFTPGDGRAAREDEDLIVSALVQYKRVDLAIEAANRLGRRLRVVGDGPLRERLERLAGPDIAFEGWASEARLIELYRTRRMLLFPGVEDFGIVPLEAMACGMPVLALRKGGLTETLPEGRCGDFFEGQAELAGAWEAFRPEQYSVEDLRANALRFSERRFMAEIRQRLAALL